MLNVFFTVDVEIWCGGWEHLDERFPDSFRRYIYGPTPKGNYGLPYMLEILNEYGLTGVFFVEPLFSRRFGSQPLAEILGLLKDSNQEIQLHLHTEWVDEAIKPLLADVHYKRQYLRYFSLEEQTALIAVGRKLIEEAGGCDVNAFRAGSFGFNADTLHALAANGIRFDSSYNASIFGQDSGVLPGTVLVEPVEWHGVYEYPMTVFNDGTSSLRHVQLTSCSFKEIEALLWQALEAKRNSFVILAHNFELLNLAKNWPDEVVVKRFRKLCSFLRSNDDSFHVCGLNGLDPMLTQMQPAPLTSSIWNTCARILEQVYRRKYK